MVEVSIAAAIVLVLLASNTGEGAVYLLYVSGAGAIALGLVIGVPAGIVYHVKLFGALSAAGAAEPGWWWKPTAHHDRLSAEARRSVIPWFRAGAAGFLVAVAGCVLVLAAVMAD